MIIVRNKLYYASLEPNLENEILSPTVPNNELANHKVGDWKTPRICYYPTPSQAVSALGQGIAGKIVYLYSPYNIRPESRYIPTLQEAPFKDKTGEVWCLTTSKVKAVGKIKVASSPSKREVLTYYNPRPTSITYVTWGWKDLTIPTKMEKVVFLSPIDKPEISIPGGTQLFRKISDAIGDKGEGEVYVTYKPDSGKLELPDTLITQKKVTFKRAGRIMITKNSYKTL